MSDLIPPESLVVEHRIGILDYGKISDDFRRIGEGIVSNMIRMELVKPNYTVLDVGCGLGRLARAMVDFLSEGEYYGLDTTRSSIDWCEFAYKAYPNFHFEFADVFSNDYNETAKVKARDYRFPYEDQKFDYVWSTSLFTHMVIDDYENYLGEMSRVMRPGSKCWNTYLILDEIALALIDESKENNARYHLPIEIDGGRVKEPRQP